MRLGFQRSDNMWKSSLQAVLLGRKCCLLIPVLFGAGPPNWTPVPRLRKRAAQGRSWLGAGARRPAARSAVQHAACWLVALGLAVCVRC